MAAMVLRWLIMMFWKETTFPLLKSHRQMLAEEHCFPDVLCNDSIIIIIIIICMFILFE